MISDIPEKIDSYMSLFSKIKNYLLNTLWDIPVRQYSGIQYKAIAALKITLLSLKGIKQDRISLRANALTLHTLMSIVPVVGLAFALAKGFGMEARLEKEILSRFENQPDMGQKLIQFSQSLLENTHGGLIAGVGILVLLFSVIMVITEIESCFNDIWEIHESRSWARRITNYISFLVLFPVLFLISSSLTAFLSSKLPSLLPGFLEGPGTYILKWISWSLIWLLFTGLYFLLPNEKVRPFSALIGGVVAGTLFLIWEQIYIKLQVNLTSYNAIYGSFAALPLFIIWLRASWTIILAGSKFSYMHQHLESYEAEKETKTFSNKASKDLALRIFLRLTKAFLQGQPPTRVEELSASLNVPRRFVVAVLTSLLRSGLVREVLIDNDQEDRAYQPGKDPSTVFVLDVLNAVENDGDAITQLPEDDKKAVETLDGFYNILKETSLNVNIKELALRQK